MEYKSMTTNDKIKSVRVSSCYLPLANPISDAKVLTGRQKPMTEIVILFAEITTEDGTRGSDLAIPNALADLANMHTPKKLLRL